MALAIKSDIDLQQDVLEEFDWDPELEPNEVGVEVDDGVVTLTGTVDLYSKKVAAERAAFRVEGVRAVANDLSVQFMTNFSDTSIAKAAADALEANNLIPPGKIDVTVKNGKVTLAGQLTWAYQRTAADNSVRHLTGVRDVINLIRLQPPKASALAIKSGIELALIRTAQIDADRIQVHTEDGHVRLTGTVRSWPEKREAADAAWRSKGVTSVTNELQVRPY